MKKAILVANWKNKPASLREVSLLLTALAHGAQLYKQIITYIAPPHTYFESVSRRAGFAGLAVQGLSSVPSGTHTGLITPEILQSFGVRLAILGHSDERAIAESDASVAKKARIALKSGITPLICVGESKRDGDGEYLETLRHQIKHSFEGINKKDEAPKIMLAYEPIWAIGKRAQNAITHESLAETVIFIRRVLSDILGRKTAEQIPILYGGSVEPRNAEALYINTGVRGFLVGHESLNAKEFAEIAKVLIVKK